MKFFSTNKFAIFNTCAKINIEFFRKMQNLVWFFQHVCKNLIKLFYKMQKLLWFFQQVCKHFQQISVLDASFFWFFWKQMQKSNLFFLIHMQKLQNFILKNLLK